MPALGPLDAIANCVIISLCKPRGPLPQRHYTHLPGPGGCRGHDKPSNAATCPPWVGCLRCPRLPPPPLASSYFSSCELWAQTVCTVISGDAWLWQDGRSTWRAWQQVLSHSDENQYQKLCSAQCHVAAWTGGECGGENLETELRFPWWEGWGEGTVIEFGLDTYTLLYWKWITNKHLLYSTGNSA